MCVQERDANTLLFASWFELKNDKGQFVKPRKP